MKILLKRGVVLLCLTISSFAFGQGFEPTQGFKQVNFGVGVSSWGIPVYVGMDFGIKERITIGPRVSYRSYDESFASSDFDYTIFNIALRGDYHYGPHIMDLPPELDLYGGLTIGYSIWNSDFDAFFGYEEEESRLYMALQAGARWYFNESWAVNAEVSGGSLAGLDVGLSYRF